MVIATVRLKKNPNLAKQLNRGGGSRRSQSASANFAIFLIIISFSSFIHLNSSLFFFFFFSLLSSSFSFSITFVTILKADFVFDLSALYVIISRNNRNKQIVFLF